MTRMTELADRSTATLPSPTELEPQLESHRTELTAYAYRMLGSAFEAEDAVQETMVRAWRALDRFEGRSQLRSWLYRITTNVCLDMLTSRERRARPMDLESASHADRPLPAPLAETAWIEPIPDARVMPAGGDPAELVATRESVKLAFMAALQHLPPRQRAVLILREVLRWRAAEVAELLETSVASVNSALQRARATLDTIGASTDDAPTTLDQASTELLDRYVRAFESYDMDALTALLHEDATWNMPPFALWLRGHRDIVDWCVGPGFACRGSKLIRTQANGRPAWGQYKPAADGGWEPWSLQVLEARGDKISEMTFFLDTARWFPLFGLPAHLDADGRPAESAFLPLDERIPR
jgi:RNA polymerase sigma-70 factor (ECF subfamily)